MYDTANGRAAASMVGKWEFCISPSSILTAYDLGTNIPSVTVTHHPRIDIPLPHHIFQTNQKNKALQCVEILRRKNIVYQTKYIKCALHFFLGFQFISGSVQMRDEEQTNISSDNHEHQIQLLYN